jgi:hypothetical protein
MLEVRLDRPELVRRAPPVSVAKPAPLAHKGRLVLKVRRAKLVHRGPQGLPGNAAKPDRKAPQVRPVQQAQPALRAIRAHHLRFASSPAQDVARCADDEILVSLVCTSGPTDGAKCATPGTPATALCVRK